MPNNASALKTRDEIAQGRLSAEKAAGDCLRQIEKRENEVQAWAHIEPERVIESGAAAG